MSFVAMLGVPRGARTRTEFRCRRLSPVRRGRTTTTTTTTNELDRVVAVTKSPGTIVRYAYVSGAAAVAAGDCDCINGVSRARAFY